MAVIERGDAFGWIVALGVWPERGMMSVWLHQRPWMSTSSVRTGEEVARPREILLRDRKAVKWGSVHARGKNLVGIGAFKEHFWLWFFQRAAQRSEAC